MPFFDVCIIRRANKINWTKNTRWAVFLTHKKITIVSNCDTISSRMCKWMFWFVWIYATQIMHPNRFNSDSCGSLLFLLSAHTWKIPETQAIWHYIFIDDFLRDSFNRLKLRRFVVFFCSSQQNWIYTENLLCSVSSIFFSAQWYLADILPKLINGFCGTWLKMNFLSIRLKLR